MDFTPHDVLTEFLKLIESDNNYCYIYWKEIPRTKVWYDETDNTFHTDLDINIVFEGYKLCEVNICLYDLHDKVINEMEKRGISLHPEHPVDSYESDHEELIHIVIEEMKRRGTTITYETIQKIKEQS